jgi:hypothetical protein
MSKLKHSRAAQWPLVSEFAFNFDDTVVAADGTEQPFTGPLAVEAIALPDGAVVIGGEIVVSEAFDTATTHTLAVGDADVPARYLAATSIKAAGRTPLVPTGHHSSKNLLLTLAATGAAPTAGKATVRVMYVILGRSNELAR